MVIVDVQRKFIWFDISCTPKTHKSLAWLSTALWKAVNRCYMPTVLSPLRQCVQVSSKFDNPRWRGRFQLQAKFTSIERVVRIWTGHSHMGYPMEAVRDGIYETSGWHWMLHPSPRFLSLQTNGAGNCVALWQCGARAITSSTTLSKGY